MKVILAALLGLAAYTAAEPTQLELIVQSAQESIPQVLDTVTTFAKSIPLRKRQVPKLRDRDGKLFKKRIPQDMMRRYDEATFNVYHRRIQNGFFIPKATVSSDADSCINESIFAPMLGFAFGL
mmetsp:Transcript_32705/g.49966  ORF Transcript_32705/g.49966 Transcript_32705/m.49966 type:complete len:124 (-) Transcript_32705:162-533(-)